MYNLLSFYPYGWNKKMRSDGGTPELLARLLRDFVVKLEYQMNIQDVMQCMETPVWWGRQSSGEL